MLFSDIVKSGIENQENKITRYMISRIEGIEMPVFISLTTDDKHNLELKMYETDLHVINHLVKPFIENPFNKEKIVNSLMLGAPLDGDNKENPRPICELHTTVWGNGVTLADIHTREDVRRKGIASFALKIVQDYYTRNKETKENGMPILYSSKQEADSNLKYKTKFEHNSGAFGDILSNVKAKIFKKDAKDAYRKFLIKNHFCLEDNEYQMPHRTMRCRNLLSDKIINEDTACNYLQILDSVIEYNLAERFKDKELN